ncbi:hypothetical protein BGX28_004572 [Mortierella sp. GBA30]|nr:hypothetical protein BGX28_004572 [Mortierella sp. GBA30]
MDARSNRPMQVSISRDEPALAFPSSPSVAPKVRHDETPTEVLISPTGSVVDLSISETPLNAGLLTPSVSVTSQASSESSSASALSDDICGPPEPIATGIEPSFLQDIEGFTAIAQPHESESATIQDVETRTAEADVKDTSSGIQLGHLTDESATSDSTNGVSITESDEEYNETVGNGADLVRILSTLAESTDADLKARAKRALSNPTTLKDVEIHHTTMESVVLPYLSSEDTQVLKATLIALAYLLTNAKNCLAFVRIGGLERLISLLESKDTVVQEKTASCLVRLSFHCNIPDLIAQPQALKILKSAAKSKVADVQRNAVTVIYNLACEPKSMKFVASAELELLPVMIELLDSPDATIQSRSAEVVLRFAFDKAYWRQFAQEINVSRLAKGQSEAPGYIWLFRQLAIIPKSSVFPWPFYHFARTAEEQQKANIRTLELRPVLKVLKSDSDSQRGQRRLYLLLLLMLLSLDEDKSPTIDDM